MNYQRHPLSAAWPNMSPEEYASLIESIQMHGQRDPIVLLDDQVLDGWHRYQACLEAGMEPAFAMFEGDDPKDYVSDKHNRRSLNLTQRMTAIALMNQWAPSGAAGHKSKGAPGAPLSQSKVAPSSTLTHSDLAKQAGGSKKTAQQVKTAITYGRKEVVKAMQDGELSAKRAAEIAKLPAKDQVRAIKEPPKPAAANDDQRDELSEAADAIVELAEENEMLRAQIAVGQMDAPEVERISAAEIIADLRSQVKTLEAEIGAMRVSRDTFQAENRELMKQLGMNAKELKRLRAA